MSEEDKERSGNSQGQVTETGTPAEDREEERAKNQQSRKGRPSGTV